MRFFFCGALATAFLLSALAPAAEAKKAAPSVAPSPSPSAAPSALRTPGKSSFPPPVVVVFPLSVTGEADKEAGSRLGLLFATRFATSGGITIKPPPPGAERKDYLAESRRLGADYYVSGYVTPIGNEVALVEQIVSTYSGIVVWSNTAQVLTYNDASSQAEIMRSAILRHAGRAVAQEDAPITQPSSAATPQTQGSGVNVGKLFSRKKSSESAPPASPNPATTPSAPPVARPQSTPRSANPPPSVAVSPPDRSKNVKVTAATGPTATKNIDVMHVTGSADAASRAYAENALMTALAAAGFQPEIDNQHTLPDTAVRFKRICERTKANALANSNIAFSGSTATLELTIYDCSGDVQYKGRVESKNGNPNTAIDRATSDLMADYLRPVRKRKYTV